MYLCNMDQDMTKGKIKMTARTFQGLEEVLAKELEELGERLHEAGGATSAQIEPPFIMPK